MKQIWKDVGLALLLGVAAPWLILGIGAAVIRNGEQPQTPAVDVGQAERYLHVLTEGVVQKMELSEYLTGVLLCELPGSFEFEAKKAQAVVARTYALRSAQTGSKHGVGVVCADASCCQGYIDTTDFLGKGGSTADVEQARQAVSQTVDAVLLYDGALIDATYFSCSGGYTEDALAVWGTDVPYLQAVPSPGEEGSAFFTDSVTFTATGFQSALGVRLGGKPTDWLGRITYTEGGGVDTMVIGGKVYTGIQLRKALGLRSTAFTMTAVGSSIVVTTRGYGHRVGMSQYGAQAMAKDGGGWEEILLYYYPGTVLGRLSAE